MTSYLSIALPAGSCWALVRRMRYFALIGCNILDYEITPWQREIESCIKGTNTTVFPLEDFSRNKFTRKLYGLCCRLYNEKKRANDY